jgi:lipoate-protein ligase A
MLCINLESEDPFFNLALEEVLLKSSREEYLILGVNNPSVIIGKHQSPHREVNTKFVTENNIPVIRRISGGGTVFHDTGNLNFTYIRTSEEGKQIDFRRYTGDVIDFLLKNGINAKFEGKNDIKVDGLKISGNAEHVHRNRVLHHGTLLFSSSLDVLRNSLRKDISPYISRAVNSNPSSVMNLRDKFNVFKDIGVFREELMAYFLKAIPGAELYTPAQSENEDAESLAMSKYRTWEWNYAYGPEYTFRNSIQIEGKVSSFSLFVKEGIIINCITDGSHLMELIAERLAGIRHMPDAVKEVLCSEGGLITEEEVFKFF